MTRILLGLTCLALTAGDGVAQVAKLLPVDEASAQPGFFTFRANLLKAVQARDTAFLYAALAPDILNSFGGNGGSAEFKELWRPAEPESQLWAVLTEILALGGTFSGDEFSAPYVFSTFPEDLDGFEHVVIVGSDVRVRARPALDAPILTTLSFDIVRSADREEGLAAEGWRRVELSDGRTGYVSASYARSPLGYRALFTRERGVWLLSVLVAGD